LRHAPAWRLDLQPVADAAELRTCPQAVREWAEANIGEVEQARTRYDAR
jgi:hypothetical protein